jgi:hypothetical protein
MHFQQRMRSSGDQRHQYHRSLSAVELAPGHPAQAIGATFNRIDIPSECIINLQQSQIDLRQRVN